MDLPKLSKKQIEYLDNAHRRWNLKVGAVRSGKSFVDIAAVIPKRIIERAGKPGRVAIFGVSRDTIERNVLEPMREIYGDRRIGTIDSRNMCKMFGQMVDCIGVEKANAIGKVQGMSLKYAYGDEIAKWSQSVFSMIESRLDKPYSCFDGACNPEGPNHWLKQWLDNPKLDAYIQQYVIFDNPFLPEFFVESLCNEYEGTVYYDRYILGMWALAEGLIYPMYQEALAAPPDGPMDDYVLSIDYGTQNAFAAILWGKRGPVWYALREYYWSGREIGVQKTDDEYGSALDAFVVGVWDGRKNQVPLRKIETIIDPSAASFIALLRKREWCRVRKAKNDVLDGIRNTAAAMKEGLIKINPNMEHTVKEIEGYAWDEKKGDDRPIKENDHACDAIRYFVETKHLMKRRNNANLSGFNRN